MLLFCRQPWQLRTDSLGFFLLLICDNRYYEKVGSEVKDITDEVPFEIPDSWAWVKLPQIAQIELGKTLNKNTDEGEDVQYLCSINVQWEGIKLDFVKRAKFTTNEQEKYLCFFLQYSRIISSTTSNSLLSFIISICAFATLAQSFFCSRPTARTQVSLPLLPPYLLLSLQTEAFSLSGKRLPAHTLSKNLFLSL